MTLYKYVLSLFTIFTAIDSWSQQPVPHGTLVVAIICNDGILFAADSRGAFTATSETDQSKKAITYAYIDSMEKIFPIHKWRIAVTGLTMLGKKFIYQIMLDYSNTHKQNDSLRQTFFSLKRYLNKNLKVSDSELFTETQYILAGYEGSIPTIYGYGFSGEKIVHRIGAYIVSDNSFIRYLKIPNEIKLKCSDIAPFIEANMIEFSKQKGDSSVGGPISILQIKPGNSIAIIKKFRTKRYKDYTDMARAIINKTLFVKYLYPYSEELLRDNLFKGIKEGY